jgi:hypothetical protein
MHNILGSDIVSYIGTFLDVESLCNLESTCNVLRSLIKGNVILWQQQCANLGIHLIANDKWNAPFISILRYCAVRKYCARRLLRCMLETPERGIGRFALNLFPLANYYRTWSGYMKSAGISTGHEFRVYMERVFPYSAYCTHLDSLLEMKPYDRRSIFLDILWTSGYVLREEHLVNDHWEGPLLGHGNADRLAFATQFFVLLKSAIGYNGSNKGSTWISLLERHENANDLAHCKGKQLPVSAPHLPVEPKPYLMHPDATSSMAITRNYMSTYCYIDLPDVIVDSVITRSQYPFSIVNGREHDSVVLGGIVPYTNAFWESARRRLKIGYEQPITPLCASDHYIIIKQCLLYAASKGTTIVSKDRDLAMVKYRGIRTIDVLPLRDVITFKKEGQS